jgi:glutamine amidotransferase
LSRPDVVVVDYGAGNPASMVKMIDYLGYNCLRTDDVDEVRAARKVILPGVGQFDHCRAQLDRRELVPALTEAAQERRVPFLGVCVGHQLLARGSEEGELPGLGWIDADVRKLRPGGSHKVPNVGWAQIESVAPSPLLTSHDAEPRSRFYFAHSYAMSADENSVLGYGHYGDERFVAVVGNGNVYGVQFHPEKSHRFGMGLLADFLELSE